MTSDDRDTRASAETHRISVAELLHREGVTQEFTAIKLPKTPTKQDDSGISPEMADAPTVRIPAASILRRESEPGSKWDKRKVGRIGAIAAGVAALCGVAATTLGAGQLHDAAAPGGAGGGPDTSTGHTPTSTISAPQQQLLASSTPSTPSLPPSGSASSQAQTQVRDWPSGTSSSGSQSSTSRSATGSSTAAETTPQPAPAPALTTSSPQPTTTPETTTTEPSEPSESSPETTTSSPSEPTRTKPGQNGGLLDVVGDLVGGLLGR